MKKILLILMFCSTFCFSQNWNVFNKEYRYNYKFNNSKLISHVLFQDSVRQSGNDTTYYLNRIAAYCSGSCSGLYGVLSPIQTVIVPNMPQFLQRSIKKFSNGLVMLLDTAKMVIKPNCILNQTWLFDSISNLNAICTALSTLNIFGVTDSVKTILINNTDTLMLSKSFGIITFPATYSKNKYYRLVGIEKRYYYDTTALFGLKVPNAWDFYNFEVGDVFCKNQTTHEYTGGGLSGSFYCGLIQTSITSKTLVSNGFLYGADIYSSSGISMYSNSIDCRASANIFSTTLNYVGLHKDSLLENKMYPNMLLVNIKIPETFYYGSSTYAFPNTVGYGEDPNGKFYKTVGPNTCGGPYPGIPTGSFYALTPVNPPIPGYTFYNWSPQNKTTLIFGENLGLVASSRSFFEHLYSSCFTCYRKNNIDVFGQPYVGLEENSVPASESGFYPNPASQELTIKINEPTGIKIYNVLGKEVYNGLKTGEAHLDLSTFENGLYTVLFNNSAGYTAKKLIIRH